GRGERSLCGLAGWLVPSGEGRPRASVAARDRAFVARLCRERAALRYAGALGDIFPGVALIIDGGCAGAACARPGGAVILARKRDAIASFLGPSVFACRRSGRS